MTPARLGYTSLRLLLHDCRRKHSWHGVVSHNNLLTPLIHTVLTTTSTAAAAIAVNSACMRTAPLLLLLSLGWTGLRLLLHNCRGGHCVWAWYDVVSHNLLTPTLHTLRATTSTAAAAAAAINRNSTLAAAVSTDRWCSTVVVIAARAVLQSI